MPVMPSISSCTFSVSEPLPAKNPAVCLSIVASTVTSTASLALSASLFKWSSCSLAPCANTACGRNSASSNTPQLIVVRGFMTSNLLDSGLRGRNCFARDLQREDNVARRLFGLCLLLPLLSPFLLLDVKGGAERNQQRRRDRQRDAPPSASGGRDGNSLAVRDSRQHSVVEAAWRILALQRAAKFLFKSHIRVLYPPACVVAHPSIDASDSSRCSTACRRSRRSLTDPDPPESAG